jgi:hypothetical protein
MTASTATSPSLEHQILEGVTKLLDDYAAVKADDVCLIAYSPDTRAYAAHIQVALALRGMQAKAFAMRPFIDPEVRGKLHALLTPPHELTGKLIIFTMERDSMSHYDVFAELLTLYPKNQLKIMRIISASDELFTTAFNKTPRELALRNATLLSKIKQESRIRVTTSQGTDLDIELDHDKFDWISNRGAWRPGAFTILPAGEIASYPANVNGVLVADGALNANVATRMDMRLEHNPLTIRIKDSVAGDYECSNPEITRLVEGCFNRENGRNIGELGFGTNNATQEFVADNSHMNERFPSLHLGFGQHNQPETIVPYVAEIHLDVITNDADIYFPNADETIRMSNFVPIPGIEHPVLIRDQDITGDCCTRGCAPRLKLA